MYGRLDDILDTLQDPHTPKSCLGGDVMIVGTRFRAKNIVRS